MLWHDFRVAGKAQTKLCSCDQLGLRLEWKVPLWQTVVYPRQDIVKQCNQLLSATVSVLGWVRGLRYGNTTHRRIDSYEAQAVQQLRIELQHAAKTKQNTLEHRELFQLRL
jgi:hypothetical protein